jgi:hypothetical protein
MVAHTQACGMTATEQVRVADIVDSSKQYLQTIVLVRQLRSISHGRSHADAMELTRCICNYQDNAKLCTSKFDNHEEKFLFVENPVPKDNSRRNEFRYRWHTVLVDFFAHTVLLYL